MPELPEVITTVNQLKAKKVVGRKIRQVFLYDRKILKKPNKTKFIKELVNRKILDLSYRGKNILFFLDNDWILLIHQKLSGHLLFGKWDKKKKESLIEGPLKEDRFNQFIRLILVLDNGFEIALSDVRRFAKIILEKKTKLLNDLAKEVAPDILNISFSEFAQKVKKTNRTIKEALLQQNLVSGIGNVYSDEALWFAKIHPLTKANQLSLKQLRKLFLALRKVIRQSIKKQGISTGTYRTPLGVKGKYTWIRKVYRRKNENCYRCQTKITALKIGTRHTYFCPKCQKSRQSRPNLLK